MRPPDACPTCGNKLLTELGGGCPACLIGESTALAPPPVGNYELGRVIGRGGMGIVYEGFQASSDDLVAVKVLHDTLGGNPELVERFLRETRALGGLDHPNIIRQIEAGTDAGCPYSIMEYMEGGTVAGRMKRGPLPPAEAARIACQVCQALAHAHARNITHRDIKPSNLLLTADGIVKVADFGLARIFGDSTAGEFDLTMSSSRLGTAYYMAPEQYRDPKSAGPRADIYSLGVVLYEMLTGELPTGRFAAPSAQVPGLPKDLDRIVIRALEPKPEARFQSADEMRCALEGVRWNPGRGKMLRFVILTGAAALVAGAAVFYRPQSAKSSVHAGGMTRLDGGSLAAPGAELWIAPEPVTRAAWDAMMPEWSGTAGGLPDKAVSGMAWPDAREYCRRLTAREADVIPAGFSYRLPLEAEWRQWRATAVAPHSPSPSGLELEWCEEVPGPATADSRMGVFGPVFFPVRKAIRTAPPHGLETPIVVERQPSMGFRVVLAPRRPELPDNPALDAEQVIFAGIAQPARSAPPLRNSIGMNFAGFHAGTVRRRLDPAAGAVSFGEGMTSTITSGFWLGTAEVTGAQYSRILGGGPRANNAAGLPVTGVTWGDAWFFCTRLTEIERRAGILPPDMDYRLPSVDQWRLAAEAGFAMLPPGEPAISEGQIWIAQPGPRDASAGRADRSGVFDLYGNVSEWLSTSVQAGEWTGDVTNPPAVSAAFVVGRFHAGGNYRTADLAALPPGPMAATAEAESTLGFRVSLVSSRRHPQPVAIDGSRVPEDGLILSGFEAGIMGHEITRQADDGVLCTWINWNDSVFWILRDLPPGRYEVSVTYGSPHYGHPYSVWLGPVKLSARTRFGGNYGPLQDQVAGIMDHRPSAGSRETVVRVQPDAFTPYGFANLAGVRLKPAGGP